MAENQGFAFTANVPFHFKAPEFSSKEGESFDQFVNKLKVYLALIDEAYLKPMESAEKHQETPITDDMFIIKEAEDDGEEDEIDEEAKKRSRNLQWLLISMITGEAAKVIQTGLQVNGYETYRRLLNRYRMHVQSRVMGRLTRIIKPDWSSGKLQDNIAQWEDEISKYERENSGKKHRLPDQLKIAIMMSETKGALR